MFLLHRILINIREVFFISYYKLIYGERFQCGSHFKVRGNFKLYIEPTGHISFGNECFVNNYFSATSLQSISIGNNCLFGEGVKIYDHNHNYKDKDKLIGDQGFTSKEVVIGNNCWIGSNVTILAGVMIGDNCVIGANCLIYKDIPSNSIVKHGEKLIFRGGGLYET